MQNIYEKYNQGLLESYEDTLRTISNINEESKRGMEEQQFAMFFNNVTTLMLKLASIEKLGEKYFEKDFKSLQNDNCELFEDIYPGNYETSFANPTYSVPIFGEGLGQLISSFYISCKKCISSAFKHKIYKLKEQNETIVKVYDYIKDGKRDVEELRSIIKPNLENQTRDHEISMMEKYDSKYNFLNDVIINSDLNDPRYLYKYGRPITEYEIKYSKYVANLHEETVAKIATTVVEAYIEGFVRDNKDRKNRAAVRIEYNIGEERIIKKVIEIFKDNSFKPFAFSANATTVNRQYGYDHRFDEALYFDKEFVDANIDSYQKAAEMNKDILSDYCGIACFETFGEPPFTPENKPECLKLSEEQIELKQFSTNKTRLLLEQYIPDKERSFTIIAFPNPQIGDKFEEIYDETIKINTLDTKLYEEIQQKIIDVLDKGECVHIKGKGSNRTDIKVKLQSINNPSEETGFFNCVADVNIPVGEVFTSPSLTGTNGVLHLNSIFLEGLEYKDLELIFKDGFVKEYTCKNFDDESLNKKFVEENLLFPHKSLPIGEFAIGTNTTAYVMANRFNIVNILPILIVEKMGPHFAIGDTCFSHSEDLETFNQNGKRMIAVDNEKSILRKTDMNEAYMNIHTDITIPYDEIAVISVATKDGENIDIIKDGRFILEGAEELNKPFDK